MHPHFLHIPGKKEQDDPGKNNLLPFQEPPHNTSEGSEFLDDAFRMKDQPLIYTEETVATGCPDNLL